MVKPAALTNARGQFVVEAILLMVLFMGLTALVARFFHGNEIFASLVKTPWTNLSGMLENGEWSAPQAGQQYHPSQHGRHVTIDGVSPYGSPGGGPSAGYNTP